MALLLKYGLAWLTLVFVIQLFRGVKGQTQCNPTTRDVEGPFFVADVPSTLMVATEEELNDESKAILLMGRVLDGDCQPIADATVDIWYAGGDRARYTFPSDGIFPLYRGKTTTDQNGQYEFLATFPGTYPGRPIPHIHYKVTTSQVEFVTQLYFRDSIPLRYESYVRRRGSQFPSSISQDGQSLGQSGLEGRIIEFNLVLNV